MKRQPDLFLSIAKICEQWLNLAGCDLAEAMSDAVWLSTRLAIEGVDWSEDTVIDKPVDLDEFDGEEEPTSSADSDENSPVEPASGEQKNPELMPSTSGDSAAYVEFESSGAPIPGRRIMFPGVPPLQGARAFERAWRPFAKRIPNAHRMQFDEQATADQIAATLGKVWSIATKPSMNHRWQGIAIFERSPTMRFWHHTLEAFYKTMWQTSAFERLQPAYVDAFGQQPAIYKNPSLTSKVDIRSITNETDNEWLFFFTDFRSNAWLNGSMLELIEDWQATTNVVLVHMMQESQWLQSALMQFELTEAKFSFSRSSKNKGLIPIFSFEPQSLGQWVGWVMGESGANTSMMSLIPKRPLPDTVPRQDHSAIDSKERMDYLYKRFIQFASEPAQMLARSFASAPLLLPVMRLIQRYEVPDSTSSHLSEILYSGLIKRVRNDKFSEHSKEKSVDPNTIEYDFLPGVRDKLLNNSSLSRIDRVLHLNWEYMQSKYGNGINFNAIIADPSQVERIASYPIANELAPFAKVGGRILQRMGGKQAEAGSSLLARLNPSETKVVYRPKETEAERLNREYESLKIELEDGTNLPKGTKFEQPRPKLFELYNPNVLRSSRVLREAIRSAGVQLVELLEQGKIVSGSMHQVITPSLSLPTGRNFWQTQSEKADKTVDGLSFDFEKLKDNNGAALYSRYPFLDNQGMRICNSSSQNFALLLGFKRMYFLSGSNSTNSRSPADDVREFQAIVEKISTAWMALFIQNANRILQFQRYAFRHSALSKTFNWYDALFELGSRKDLAFAFDRFVVVNHDDQLGDRIVLVGDGLFPRLPENLPKEIVARIPHQLGYPTDSESYIPDMVAASVTAINYLLGEDLQEQRRRQLVLSADTESVGSKGRDAHFEVKTAPVDAREIEFADGTNVPKGSTFRELVSRSSRGKWYLPSKTLPPQNEKNDWQAILSQLEQLRSENIRLACRLLQKNIPQIGKLEYASIRNEDTQAIRMCSGLGREFCQLIQMGKEPLISDYAFEDVTKKPILNAVGEAGSFRLGFSRQFLVYQHTEMEDREAYELSQQIFTAFRNASEELQKIPPDSAKVIWRHWPDGFDSADFGEDSLWYDALFELAFNRSLKLPFQTERFVGVSSIFDPSGRIQLVGDGLFPRIPTTITEEAFHSIPNQLGYPDYFEAELPDLVQASIEAIEMFIEKSQRLVRREREYTSAIDEYRDLVFLSYSKHDEEYASELRSCLENNAEIGRSYFDRHEIQPGTGWSRELESRMSKTRIVIFLVSPTSLESKFCMREVRFATKYHASGKIKIIWLAARTIGSKKIPFSRSQAATTENRPLESMLQQERGDIYRQVCREVIETFRLDARAVVNSDVTKKSRKGDGEVAKIKALLWQLRDGQASAIDSLFSHFFQRLSEIGQKLLRNKSNLIDDGDDVASYVLYQVFERLKNGKYPEVLDENDLLLLLKIAVQRRIFDLVRGDVVSRRGASVMKMTDLLDRMGTELDEIPESQADPLQYSELDDLWSVFLGQLSGQGLREIAKLKFEGFSNRDIAQRLLLTPRSVDRKVQFIRQAWVDEVELQAQVDKPKKLDSKKMKPSELRSKLSNLPGSMFDELVFEMDAEKYIQGRNSAQSTRAIDLVKYAQATNQLDKLIRLYEDMTGNKTIEKQSHAEIPVQNADSEMESLYAHRSDARLELNSQIRFAIALSFPGEHREFVLSVANELAKEVGRDRVFYDEWYEVKLVGVAGDLKLQLVYENAEMVVPFFSQHYSKPWCEMEWETIRGILLERRKDDCVIPVAMDDTKIPGWSKVNFAIRRKNRTPKMIAALIAEAYRDRVLQHSMVAVDAIDSKPAPTPVNALVQPVWGLVFERLLWHVFRAGAKPGISPLPIPETDAVDSKLIEIVNQDRLSVLDWSTLFFRSLETSINAIPAWIGALALKALAGKQNNLICEYIASDPTRFDSHRNEAFWPKFKKLFPADPSIPASKKRFEWSILISSEKPARNRSIGDLDPDLDYPVLCIPMTQFEDQMDLLSKLPERFATRLSFQRVVFEVFEAQTVVSYETRQTVFKKLGRLGYIGNSTKLDRYGDSDFFMTVLWADPSPHPRGIKRYRPTSLHEIFGVR